MCFFLTKKTILPEGVKFDASFELKGFVEIIVGDARRAD